MAAIAHDSAAGAAPAGVARTMGRRKSFTIGEVIKRLQSEYPDIKVSKVRFLESEGLISPERSESGYRRFSEADIDRLNFILSAQRDSYLPLKVIKEQLEAMDSGAVMPLNRELSADTIVGPSQFIGAGNSDLTVADLAERSGADIAFVRSLVSNKLVVADYAGRFNAADVSIVSAAANLVELGFDMTQLNSLKVAAQRQAELIGRAARLGRHPVGSDADEFAQETARMMSALAVTVSAGVIKQSLQHD